MQMEQRMQTKRGDRVVFLQEFLKNPLQVASIIPSSRFLERRIVELAEVRTARTVIELGGGTGGTARAMLAAMPSDAKLMIVEINPNFCELLKRIKDKRLIVHCGSAQELQPALSLNALAAPDVVVSGIPFSTINHLTGSRILQAISLALAPGGRFVAYQLSSQVDNLSRPLLGPARMEVEFLNIPPVRLYRWDKRNGNGPVPTDLP